MKNIFFYTVLLSFIFSCVKEVETKTINKDGGGSGTICSGTTSDGDGQGSFPLHIREVLFAGNYSGTNPEWIPKYYDAAMAATCGYTPVPSGLPTYGQAKLLVNSVDTKLRARVKVLAQPTTPDSPNTCPFQVAGSESYPPVYSMLRFTIQMYALVPRANNPNCFDMIATPYSYESPNPVNVGSCSQIFDIPYKGLIQPAYTQPVVFAITNVRSDFECAFHNGDGGTVRCPAEKRVRNQSCFKLVLEVATDATDDFTP